MDETSDSASYQDAQRKVRKLKGFYSQLASFIVVNLMLLLINLAISPDHLWFYWVTIIWGIFLVWTAINLISDHNMMGKDWEERKIKEYMEKK